MESAINCDMRGAGNGISSYGVTVNFGNDRSTCTRGEEHIDSIISPRNSGTNRTNETMEDRTTLENPESARPSP